MMLALPGVTLYHTCFLRYGSVGSQESLNETRRRMASTASPVSVVCPGWTSSKRGLPRPREKRAALQLGIADSHIHHTIKWHMCVCLLTRIDWCVVSVELPTVLNGLRTAASPDRFHWISSVSSRRLETMALWLWKERKPKSRLSENGVPEQFSKVNHHLSILFCSSGHLGVYPIFQQTRIVFWLGLWCAGCTGCILHVVAWFHLNLTRQMLGGTSLPFSLQQLFCFFWPSMEWMEALFSRNQGEAWSRLNESSQLKCWSIFAHVWSSQIQSVSRP